MDLVVVSAAMRQEMEEGTIKALFEAGMDRFHIKRSRPSFDEIAATIEAIPESSRKKVILHSHFSLCRHYLLGGVHLSRDARKDKELLFEALDLREEGFSLSTSFHDGEELGGVIEPYDYVFLGPVFPSYSKPGYGETKQASLPSDGHPFKVIAIGGIDHQRILQVKEMGFNGAALRGAVWSSIKPEEEFIKVRRVCH